MLPLEIIDHIFSFLQSDSFALEKCSKAHPILSELVPKHLYANIAIRVPGRFSNLLASDDLNANYVRNLQIELVWSIHESSSRRLLDQEKIALMLPKFRMLRGIALHVGDVDDPPTEWPLLHEKFREAFTQCLRLPSMIGVSILGTSEFPLTTFRNCTSIKRLALGGEFDFDDPSSDSSLSLVTYPQIVSLALYGCQGSSSAIVSWAKICSPHSLRLTLPSDFELLQSLVPIYSNTLVSLELDLGGACMSITLHDDFFNKLFICFPLRPIKK